MKGFDSFPHVTYQKLTEAFVSFCFHDIHLTRCCENFSLAIVLRKLRIPLELKPQHEFT